ATDARLLPSLAANLAGDSAVRLASLEALEGWGKQASAVVPAVVELRNNKEAAVRSAAVQTLAAIDADIPHLVGELRAALADADWDVRRVAAESLGQLGPAAEAAVPQLFGMLANEEDSDFASSALRGIDAAPLEALSLLSEQLDSTDGRTSAYAIFLLGKLGAQATEILPRLEKMLQDTEAGKGGIREKYLKQAIAAIKGE
ncbi:MAG: HEAT repeat domain-containing protein, partial [Planctomycetales bacterium]|nr:HEAT repeat domain-containing protein [Planctomycetales bacterium]